MYKTILGEGGKERRPTFFLPAAFQVRYDSRIQPRGYSIEDSSIAIPHDVKGPVTVEVEAKYRSAPQFLINDLLAQDAPVLTIFTMGKAEKTIELQ